MNSHFQDRFVISDHLSLSYEAIAPVLCDPRVLVYLHIHN